MKIKFKILRDNYTLSEYENIHCTQIGTDKYMLDNYPLFINGLSYSDIICVKFSESWIWYFEKIYKKWEYSTIRLYFPESMNSKNIEWILNTLNNMWVSYEGYKNYLFSLNIWSTIDKKILENFLDNKEKQEELFYEWSDFNKK